VFGNIDDESLRDAFPEDERFGCERSTVWMTHIGGRPGNYDRRVAKMLTTDPPRLFICGHSHILRIEQDKRHQGMIYLNPGAAGHQGFHLVRTIVTLEFVGDQIGNLKVIELGPRGRVVKSKRSPES
jgi:predicted phosphodiesterase